MKKSWTLGLEPDIVEEIRLAFKSSLVARRRLVEMLQKKIDEADDGSIKAIAYGDATWPYRQADYIGYKRALKDIQSLLTDGEE